MRIANHRLAGCSFVESPNQGGVIEPVFVVIHFTASFDAADAIDHLINPDSPNPVSAHLVLDREGAVTQLVPFNIKAWHAGKSRYKTPRRTYVGLNGCSIGIELVNPGWFTMEEGGAILKEGREACREEDLRTIAGFVEHKLVDGRTVFWACYHEAQLAALELVVRALAGAYPGIRYVVGHSEIAPSRKLDPGPAFPIDRFRRLVPAAPSGSQGS